MLRKITLFIFSATLAVACSDSDSARGGTVSNGDSGKPQAHEYQIGATWDRVNITEDFSFESAPVVLQQLARATGRLENITGTGTVFYIGKFDGKHFAATNNHVVDDEKKLADGMKSLTCIPIDIPSAIGYITFNRLFNSNDQKIKCVGLVGRWESLDFAIIEIFDYGNTGYLDTLTPLKFSASVPAKGTELLTIGYGKHFNPDHNLQKATYGKNCRLFSENVYNLLDNESPIQSWSLATSCDISHGDSGSAVVNLENGQIVGLVWSTFAMNLPKVLSEDYLNELYNAQDTRVWNELSYAVPTSKVVEALQEWTETTDPQGPYVEAIRQFLDTQVAK